MESDWASLPRQLVDSILEKMETLRDCLRLGAVCASWHSAVIKSPIKFCQEIPMLLVPSKDNDSHTMYNALTNTFLESKFVVPYAKRFAGSSHGWLVAVEEDFSVTLYKPYSELAEGTSSNTTTTTTIRLPPLAPDLLYVDKFDYHVFKATMSADPLRDPDQCIVAAIFGNERRLGFIRLGKDTTWTVADGDMNETFNEILYYNGQFYALILDGSMFSLEITDQPFKINVKLAAPEIPYDIIGKTYLVESQGKLLQVLRYMDWCFASHLDDTIDPFGDNNPLISRETTYVYVYELDFDKQTWVEIESLGDAALFMGDSTSKSLLASEFPGCKPNCIYFTHDTDMLCSDKKVRNNFGIYDFENHIMKENFDLDTTSLSKMCERVSVWVDISEVLNLF